MKAMIKIAVVLSLASAMTFTSSAALRAQEPIRVGATFAITGPASFLGEPERNTVKMIEEQINAAGGINGRPLNLIIYDNVGDPTKTVEAANRLIKNDKVVAIIGPSQTPDTLPIIPIVEKEEITLMAAAAGNPIIQPVKKWVFSTPQTNAQAIDKILDYIGSKKLSKAAMISINNAFGDDGREQLQMLAPKKGVQVVATEKFDPKDTDMTAQLTKIKASGAMAVLSWSVGPPPAIVTKNFRQLGMQVPLIQSHGVASKKYIEMAGTSANGVLLPAGRLIVANQLTDTDPQKKLLLKYIKDYEEKFKQPVSTFGGHAWDGLMLVVNALKQVGPDKAKIRDRIENTKNFIGTAGIFNYSPTDHNGLTKDAFVMVEIVSGDWKLLQF